MISEYFTDDDIVTQLRCFFDEDEQERVDFYNALSTVEQMDEDSDYFSVKCDGRFFRFHKILGDVEEDIK